MNELVKKKLDDLYDFLKQKKIFKPNHRISP